MADQFTWPASIGTGSDSKTRVKKAQFGDGYAQRAADGLNPVLTNWRVTVRAQTLADADAIEAFFTAHVGIPFDWTPLNGGTISVVCESWSRNDRIASSVITATFERIFAP